MLTNGSAMKPGWQFKLPKIRNVHSKHDNCISRLYMYVGLNIIITVNPQWT